MISPPRGKYPKKVIIVHDGKTEWEIEVCWACTGCGYDTRTVPTLEYFPAQGYSFHTWLRTCMCGEPEYYWDLLEQARLYGQIISQGGSMYRGNTNGVFCVRCRIHCPYTSELNYTCWSCKMYPFYQSGDYDDE